MDPQCPICPLNWWDVALGAWIGFIVGDVFGFWVYDHLQRKPLQRSARGLGRQHGKNSR